MRLLATALEQPKNQYIRYHTLQETHSYLIVVNTNHRHSRSTLLYLKQLSVAIYTSSPTVRHNSSNGRPNSLVLDAPPTQTR